MPGSGEVVFPGQALHTANMPGSGEAKGPGAERGFAVFALRGTRAGTEAALPKRELFRRHGAPGDPSRLQTGGPPCRIGGAREVQSADDCSTSRSRGQQDGRGGRVKNANHGCRGEYPLQDWRGAGGAKCRRLQHLPFPRPVRRPRRSALFWSSSSWILKDEGPGCPGRFGLLARDEASEVLLKN